MRAAAGTAGGSSGDLPYVVGGVVEPLSAAPSASTANGVVVTTTTMTNKACPSAGMRKRSGQRERSRRFESFQQSALSVGGPLEEGVFGNSFLLCIGCLFNLLLAVDGGYT